MNVEHMRELAEAKVSSIMKDHLVMLARGKQPGSDSIETMMRLTASGLVTYEDREYTLTPEGAKLVQNVISDKQKTKQVKNRNARTRHATMKSLGLTRTRTGAYEDVGGSLRPFVETLRDLLDLEEAAGKRRCPPGLKMVFGKCRRVDGKNVKFDRDAFIKATAHLKGVERNPDGSPAAPPPGAFDKAKAARTKKE